jgi:hypothetical protein
VPVEGAEVNGTDLPAGWARKAQPREPSFDRGTNGRVEPKLASASLPRIPDRNDFLRLGDGPALSFGTLGLSRNFGSGTLPLLRSAVRSHAEWYRSKRRQGNRQ